jgi:hypothetical protein
MTSLINAIKRALRTPDASALAGMELSEARRQLLVAESGLDWAKSQVQYHTDRIKRLEEKFK